MTSDQLKQVAERAIKTFFQSFVAVILASEVTDIYSVDWQQAAGVGALAAVVSVATSLASWNIGPDEGPSLVGEGRKAKRDQEIGD